MSNESREPEWSTRRANLRFKEIRTGGRAEAVGVIENPEIPSEWIESTVYYPVLD